MALPPLTTSSPKQKSRPDVGGFFVPELFT
jgi:hypothetical protein